LQAPAKKEPEIRKRKDDRKPNVILNEKRIKKTANSFMLGDIPYPYSSRAEYEQAMIGGVGQEWNVTSAYKNMTRPEILTRSGKMIQPISKKAKRARPAAKF
jgi:U3 small nucleolar RNA-associated protein 14